MTEQLAGKRVLLLEDEALVAMMAEEMLAELGALVVGPVYDLELAQSLIARETLDLALLDLNISGRSSLGLGQALRDRGVALVFATGYHQPDLSAFPGAAILEKPYSLAHLRAALLAALGA